MEFGTETWINLEKLVEFTLILIDLYKNEILDKLEWREQDLPVEIRYFTPEKKKDAIFVQNLEISPNNYFICFPGLNEFSFALLYNFVAFAILHQEHTVIESKPDHFLDDLRLNNPWPELKRLLWLHSLWPLPFLFECLISKLLHVLLLLDCYWWSNL